MRLRSECLFGCISSLTVAHEFLSRHGSMHRATWPRSSPPQTRREGSYPSSLNCASRTPIFPKCSCVTRLSDTYSRRHAKEASVGTGTFRCLYRLCKERIFPGTSISRDTRHPYSACRTSSRMRGTRVSTAQAGSKRGGSEVLASTLELPKQASNVLLVPGNLLIVVRLKLCFAVFASGA